jgi:hypothetical protein
MKVAAYQAPLLPIASPRSRAIELIRERVRRCEVDGVSISCRPEAVLGGLADYAADPGAIAIEHGLVSYGSTGITVSDGSLVQTARAVTAEVVVADLRVETAIHT